MKNRTLTIYYKYKIISLLTPVSLFLFYLLPFTLFSQTRGHSAGEIYVSTTWYNTGSEAYNMIVHSTDNGKTLKPKYIYKHESGNIPVGKVLSDATPGVLYMTAQNKLYISQDSAKSWTYVENIPAYFNNYATGLTEGEIYKNISNYDSMRIELFRSDSYGEEYNLTNTHIGGIVEVGAKSDEVYYRIAPSDEESALQIYFSSNAGIDFQKISEYSFLSDTAGGIISGNYPKISRGTNSGELYLISWHLPANYKIFRSTNYGETFELQYEQTDTCNFFFESYSFTAGRAPGEFYIFKKLSWFDGYNTRLHVYYSSDYAQTFMEYEHLFDSEWTSVNEQWVISNEQLSNHPNPFSDVATINYSNSGELKNAFVEIYAINGQLISVIPFNGNSVEWNATNQKPGMYLYRLKSDNYISCTNIMIKIE